jgi:SAM-dependent methyltransferase
MATTIDYGTITQRQQATWSAGDFNVLALGIMPVSDALVLAADPHAGQRVLDIACGSGNTSLVAARRHADVYGIDYVPALVERAKQRATAEGTKIDFQTADAQALPFPDGHFDVVLSVFGVMFAPDQEKAASELLRVTRSGGRIGLANWMPEAIGGDLFGLHAKFVPPPAGLKPGVRWGTDVGARELIGAKTSALSCERRRFSQYFRSEAHALEVFRTYFGPTKKAFEIVEPARHPELEKGLLELFHRYNRASDGTAVLESEYMQMLATKA